VLVTTTTGNEWAYPLGGLLLMGAVFLLLRRT
jgi:LPXTG-motif cell wall-anchored protein